MPKVSRQVSKLTPKEWAEIVELYEMGLLNLTEIAERYKASRSGIESRLKRENRIYGVKAAQATREAMSDLEDDMHLTMAKAKQCKDDAYKYATLLSKLAMRKIQQAETKEDGYNYEIAEQEIRTLSLALKVTGDARKEQYTVLGLDREDLLDDDLPSLNITEMSEMDILTVKKEQVERLRATGGLADDFLISESGDIIEEDEG